MKKCSNYAHEFSTNRVNFEGHVSKDRRIPSIQSWVIHGIDRQAFSPVKMLANSRGSVPASPRCHTSYNKFPERAYDRSPA